MGLGINPQTTTVADATQGCGILAYEPGSGVVVNNNIVSAPSANFGDAGIFFYSADAATATGNTISNEGYALVAPVVVYDSNRTVIGGFSTIQDAVDFASTVT